MFSINIRTFKSIVSLQHGMKETEYSVFSRNQRTKQASKKSQLANLLIQATFPVLLYWDQARETTIINTKFPDIMYHIKKKNVLSLGSYKITAYSLHILNTEPKKKPICELCVNQLSLVLDIPLTFSPWDE